MDDHLDAHADELYCYLTTTGRVSGLPREIEIWFAIEGGRLYMLSGGRPDGSRSDWVRNLMRDPRVRVRLAGRTFEATASLVEAPEEDALARRLLYDKYQPHSSNNLAGWRERALPVALDLTIEVSSA